MVIGLFVAIFSEKQFTASCTMVPQTTDGGVKLGGSLGGLAAMAGVNLGAVGGSSDIPPSLYPNVVNSVPFLKEVMKTPLTIEGEESTVTFEKYYEEVYKPGLFGYIKKYSIGLPGIILKAIRGGNVDGEEEKIHGLHSITMEEKELIKCLQDQLIVEYDEKEGCVYLSARMPEALAAAQLAQRVQSLLQTAITDFKINKAKDQLSFVQTRFNEKKNEADSIQNVLAQFRDRNKNVSTATAQTELERLTNEYDLVYGVYSELAKQLETQKIQVKEDTPVFTVIEPVSIPYDKSKPKRGLILIIWTFLGGIIGIVTVFAKYYWFLTKDQWVEDVV
jgi:uncharacterized protein involved in exopolysaccharide biosynthesis